MEATSTVCPPQRRQSARSRVHFRRPRRARCPAPFRRRYRVSHRRRPRAPFRAHCRPLPHHHGRVPFPRFYRFRCRRPCRVHHRHPRQRRCLPPRPRRYRHPRQAPSAIRGRRCTACASSIREATVGKARRGRYTTRRIRSRSSAARSRAAPASETFIAFPTAAGGSSSEAGRPTRRSRTSWTRSPTRTFRAQLRRPTTFA
jgi:hypothetical protein